MNKLIRHTPRVWCRIKRIKILDPDGWRNDKKSFNAPLTEDEFDRRMMLSTIEPLVGNVGNLFILGHDRRFADEEWDDGVFYGVPPDDAV